MIIDVDCQPNVLKQLKLPHMSALVDTVVVRQTIGCASPIETQYYSATLVSFPPVCYYCGASEESLVEDDNTHQLKQDYAIVRPLCFLCKSEGKTPFVRMPTNIRKRPRLHQILFFLFCFVVFFLSETAHFVFPCECFKIQFLVVVFHHRSKVGFNFFFFFPTCLPGHCCKEESP